MYRNSKLYNLQTRSFLPVLLKLILIDTQNAKFDKCRDQERLQCEALVERLDSDRSRAQFTNTMTPDMSQSTKRCYSNIIIRLQINAYVTKNSNNKRIFYGFSNNREYL